MGQCLYTPVAAKSPDCEHEGNSAYYTCSCGKWYKDSTANIEITDKNSVKINANGHNFTKKETNDTYKRSTAADCRTKDTYWYICATCNVSAEGKDATKFYEGEAGQHVFSEEWNVINENGHSHKCKFCDEVDELYPHRPDRQEATENEPVKCLDCGRIITPALGHTHVLVNTPGKNATCTEDGKKDCYVCEGCGKIFADRTGNVEISDAETLVIKATGHDYQWIIDKKPTAAEDGSKHEECTKCHDKKPAVVIPKTGTDSKPEGAGDTVLVAAISMLVLAGAGLTVIAIRKKKNY